MASHLYWHCALDGPASAPVIQEQLDLLCGLPVYPESLSVVLSSVVSDQWMPWWWRRLEKANVARHLRVYRGEPGKMEFPTLQRIIKDLTTFDDISDRDEIGYFHTKGAYSHGQYGTKVTDWRRLMEHFVLRQADSAICYLRNNGKPFDAVGCNLGSQPQPHFSGNFWWATGSYLRRLPPLKTTHRNEAEFWIGTGKDARLVSLFDSKVNHYEVNYGPENYAAFR